MEYEYCNMYSEMHYTGHEAGQLFIALASPYVQLRLTARNKNHLEHASNVICERLPAIASRLRFLSYRQNPTQGCV